jgi:hypothetical protein
MLFMLAILGCAIWVTIEYDQCGGDGETCKKWLIAMSILWAFIGLFVCIGCCTAIMTFGMFNTYVDKLFKLSGQ